MKKFGEALKELRTSAKLTQEQLAQKCGMTKQSISRYEKSDREPNIRTAKTIADALGVPLSSLVPSKGPIDASGTIPGLVVEPAVKWADKDMRLLHWFRSLPPEKQKAILIAQDAPEDLV